MRCGRIGGGGLTALRHDLSYSITIPSLPLPLSCASAPLPKFVIQCGTL